jgi:hypothetical protein
VDLHVEQERDGDAAHQVTGQERKQQGREAANQHEGDHSPPVRFERVPREAGPEKE